MITRLATIENAVASHETDAFRTAVLTHLVPLWHQFPGSRDVSVMFGDESDKGAPENPRMLAIACPDRSAMEDALESPARFEAKEATGDFITTSPYVITMPPKTI